MISEQEKGYSDNIIKVEDEYQRQEDHQNLKRQSIDYLQPNYKVQMSAIEEEDRLFQNSNTEAMTISQIDNFLMQSTTQGDMANLTNLNLAEHINNITDADLRRQLMRYDTEDAQTNQNANDLSYSNLSQIHQSLSNFVDTKEDYLAQGNVLSGIKGSSNKEEGMQFQFEKSSKYFQKFINGENLNDSSVMQSSSQLYEYPNSQRIQPKDMRNLLQDLYPAAGGQDINALRTQLNESTQRYKQTLIQNKILVEGYEKLKQQVDELTEQVKSKQFLKKNKHYLAIDFYSNPKESVQELTL